MDNLFGNKGTGSEGLSGHFYDLKQSRGGTPTGMASPAGEAVNPWSAENNRYSGIVREFTARWDESLLAGYYRSPAKLTTYHFLLPYMSADEAPRAFGAGRDVEPRRWLIHYKGEVKAPRRMAFRFVGAGDDVLVVRFNKRVVLDASASAPGEYSEWPRVEELGRLTGPDSAPLQAGSWVQVQEGSVYPMEVLLGEKPGGGFAAFLLVQERGVEYAPRPDNRGPALPLFQAVPAKTARYEPERNGPTMAAAPLAFDPP